MGRHYSPALIMSAIHHVTDFGFSSLFLVISDICTTLRISMIHTYSHTFTNVRIIELLQYASPKSCSARFVSLTSRFIFGIINGISYYVSFWVCIITSNRGRIILFHEYCFLKEISICMERKQERRKGNGNPSHKQLQRSRSKRAGT